VTDKGNTTQGRLTLKVHSLDYRRAVSATPPSQPLSDADYRRLTDAVLASIEVHVDRWLEDDVVDIDVNRTGGLLELSFSNRAKIVVNTQPPLQELWLAARSGGHHFKHIGGRWLDTRDGVEFHARLSECASHEAGQALTFKSA
jgi:CyaY protein